MPLFNKKGEIIGAIEIGQDTDSIKNLYQKIITFNEQLYLKNDTQEINQNPIIITRNEKMKEVLHTASIYAVEDFPVLVYGETGVGKELLIRYIHSMSKYANKPFIPINCAAIPETLLESTLFGTIKGAFTNAENRKGLISGKWWQYFLR
nr:sigma 54-interacting transcriptional regulator [Thermoanaerobacterium xylanolyticum]